ncbi:phage tail tube protein [Sphingomonas naphthae]|uniref:Phage tail tube protein n=1 Tax=Sphingomonas naphthae TaxID=1813468 RepID=A0ABY7TNF4_9SPHN|nr:phage tail tube protein [Sphingomonas naphthae]WCT73930.1 phage tail tube protein [Sphingomonas naphthae]
MARARGANAKAAGAFETTPGTVPGSGFFSIPFVSHTLGEERPLIESDLLGQGREMQDPTPDVATNDGDIVVPVDARNFWYWLKLYFGSPTISGSGPYVHTFTSGATTLPSMSIEIGSPEVPAFSVNRGARGNQMRIGMSRSGQLNATCSLICIGETDIVSATVAGTPSTKVVARFPQAVGQVSQGGSALGSVVSADFAYSNSLEKVETIKSDGRIEDSDPGMVGMTGTIRVRFKDTTLLTAATNGTPVSLSFGWAIGAHSLSFNVQRVFLPKPKKPIPGPNGIMVEFSWQASGASGAAVTAVLTNDVSGASY